MSCAIFQGYLTVCIQYIYYDNILLLSNLMESDKQYKWFRILLGLGNLVEDILMCHLTLFSNNISQ